MSYLHPDIDTQHLIEQAMNSKSLASLGRMHDESVILQMSPEQYAQYIKRLEDARKTGFLSSADETLAKLGVNVKYNQDKARLIEKFNSGWTQIKLKQMKSNLSEKDLLNGASEVVGDCDLRGTSIQDLSFLKKIGGTLTVDTSSQLKNLNGVKEILGSVFVHAKNESCAKEFIKAVGLNSAAIKGKIIPVIKNYL